MESPLLTTPSSYKSTRHQHLTETVSSTLQHMPESKTDHQNHGHFDLYHQNHGDDLSFTTSGSSHADHEASHSIGQAEFKPVLKWVKTTYVLVDSWTTSTILELVLAMLAAAFLSAMYDWLRNYLSTWDNAHPSFTHMTTWRRTCLRVYRSFMHALAAALVYVQMLFAMTYDIRILVAIILGSGLGFLILGPYFRRLTAKQKLKVLREITSNARRRRVHGHSGRKEEREQTQQFLEQRYLADRDDNEEQDEFRSSVIVPHEAVLLGLSEMTETSV